MESVIHILIALVAPHLKGGSRLEALIDLSQVLTALELRINGFCQKKKKRRNLRVLDPM